MKTSQTALFVCLLSLSDVVLGDLPLPSLSSVAKASPPTPSPPNGRKKTDPPSAIPAASSTVTITASIISTTPLSTATVQPSNLATTINTIDVSSFMTSSSSATLTSSGAASTPSSYNGTSMSSASTVSQAKDSSSISHQTLVIILSTVLGSVGLVLLAGALFLLYRFSRGQTPFGHRGASPINDDEIESWRRSGREKHQMTPPDHGPAIRDVTSLPLHSPAWTWAASPSSIRTVSANLSELHSVVAKAPNARAGLTDEALPGADPFITPPKRQSSRLSKPPPGHARTKSRRSSISTKSMWSGRERSSSDLKAKDRHSTWYDQDDEVISSHIRTDNGSSSPGASDFFDGMPSGGLSPRPKSRPRLYEISKEDIGRAIA
ncbi:uncharacterized protein LY89DRAFT_442736 [Mollisia scopiformis]|uniref:Uncharacterized protein n=1 Tax=Mollisia scopiformis TaxID=149040 RepID=A0A194XKV4_MOLSC|nr:uncharacterized protein LY89DRAFT_442736 [Mollisia scopiformis]KUJ20407.1 hypothetical protein LY89DRAFT_442736 [Mollisia scopiformis]